MPLKSSSHIRPALLAHRVAHGETISLMRSTTVDIQATMDKTRAVIDATRNVMATADELLGA